MNIARLRWIILAASFLLLLFGAYAKLNLGAFLPTFACTYVFPRGGSCFLVTLQKAFGVFTLASMANLLGLVALFSILVVIIGRAWCGWICPMGLIQDFLYAIRKSLGGGYVKFGDSILRKIAWIKWTFLGVALALPAWMAFPVLCPGVALNFYIPFCQLCPGKFILPYCSASSPGHISFSNRNGTTVVMSILGLVISIATLVGSTIKSRFWCLFCPMGLILSWYRKIAFLKLKKNDLKCTKCDICFNVCPSEIKEVAQSSGQKDVTLPACNLCLKCVEHCPETGALKAEYLGREIYVSSSNNFFEKHVCRRKKNSAAGPDPDSDPISNGSDKTGKHHG